MTQTQQPEALRLAAICETKGMFPVADELNRMHARILELELELELEQGKCLHQIAEPVPIDAARAEFEAFSKFSKCEWSLDWDKAGFYSDVKVDAAFIWFMHGYMRSPRAAAPQAVQPTVPVIFVSREQLESHTDHLASEAGRYLPARKTAVGKFTMPLRECQRRLCTA
jgi:hypothetical protein